MFEYDTVNRWVFRRSRKVSSDGADVTCGGRLFQTWGPATGKALSPTVDGLDCGWMRRLVLAERRARRLGKSATRTNGPRYDGAQPWRTSYVSTAILNWMRCGMRSQCRLISASDTWSVSVLTRDYKMVCYLQRIFNRYRKFKQEVSKLSVLKLDVCSKSMHATFSFAFFSRYAEAGTSNFR